MKYDCSIKAFICMEKVYINSRPVLGHISTFCITVGFMDYTCVSFSDYSRTGLYLFVCTICVKLIPMVHVFLLDNTHSYIPWDLQLNACTERPSRIVLLGRNRLAGLPLTCHVRATV